MIRFIGAVLALFVYSIADGQVSIIVFDSIHSPLQGALVTMDDQQCVTDAEGICSFEVVGQRLMVQMLGYHDEVQDPMDQSSTSLIEVQLRSKIFSLQGVELIASWVSPGEPFTHAIVDREELEARNLGMDVPYLLQYTPGAVVTSDAGTGIGYTGYRLRGSDATRINVTIDGIPLNDSESQGVFWVDLPDFANSVEAIQVQRGVGPSTNGAGAFGGTISLKTKGLEAEPYARIDGSVGSYGTRRAAVSFGTGRLGRYITFDGRASTLSSDGYIDRGSADLHSFFGSGKYLKGRTSISMNVFTGHERTYQAWNGVPLQWVDDDELRNSNTAGIRADGSFHPDEVDDYRQTHVHLKLAQDFANDVSGRIALHYTRGKGFFEQYRVDDPLALYGFGPIQFEGLQVDESDLIRRRWLDNHFVGGIFSLEGDQKNNFKWHLGGGFNTYVGDHFGEVIWSRLAGDSELGHEYYRNDAQKSDANLYARFNVDLSQQVEAFTDLQYRFVDYRFEGFNGQLIPTDQQIDLHFFNPKLGFVWKGPQFEAYYSLSAAHREPNRSDYTDSSPASRPKPERLWDHELGIRGQSTRYSWSLNGYFMDYSNQLVLTGELNDVGESVRQNVAKSHRLGLELAGRMQLNSALALHGNATISSNKIEQFTEFIDSWDTGDQIEVEHKNTDIAFSPPAVLYGGLQWSAINHSTRSLDLFWHHKFVDRQFLDNTANQESSLDSYYFSDVEVRFNVRPSWCKQIAFRLQLRNLFNTRYASNGWIYRYQSDGYDGRLDDPHTRLQGDGFYNLTGLYPQALRNFLAGVVVDL